MTFIISVLILIGFYVLFARESKDPLSEELGETTIALLRQIKIYTAVKTMVTMKGSGILEIPSEGYDKETISRLEMAGFKEVQSGMLRISFVNGRIQF